MTMVLFDSDGEDIVGFDGGGGGVGPGHGMRVGEENMDGKRDFGFGRR